MKRLAYILVAVLLIVGLVGIAGCGRGRISPAPSEPDQIQLPPPPPPVPPPPDGPDQATWGESRTTPVALNYGLTYGDHKLVVQAAERFDKIGSQTPETGKTWLVVAISYECLSPCDFDVGYLRVVGDSNRIYEACLDVKTRHPLQSSEHYGITRVSGYVVYDIDQTETDLMLMWNCDRGVERFFELDLLYERNPRL